MGIGSNPLYHNKKIILNLKIIIKLITAIKNLLNFIFFYLAYPLYVQHNLYFGTDLKF